MKEIHQRSANRLLEGCLLNGGLYIKIGQGVAAINHILPVEYTDTLKLLEDKCLVRKTDEVKRLFLEDFGKPPENLFAEFNYEPFAAASLAQVFRAKTKAGDDVAVKVQYIDLQKRFRGDVGTILFLQDIISFVHKNYNFGWIIRDLRKSLEMELDFVHEADNGERCAKDLKHFNFVHIPRVHRELTGKRVLTAEFIDDACKISDMESLKKMKINVKDVDFKLVEVFAYQIFTTGFVHGDPHPGNVFVRKRGGKTELVLLDHGLYETIPEGIRNDLCCFWEAIVLRDYERMKIYSDKLNVSDYKRFAEILLQKPLEVNKFSFATKYTEDEVLYMKKVASKHFNIIMKVLKEMPRNLLFIVRNLNIVRAIAREHGDLVDRPKIMARFAISNLFTASDGNVFRYMTRKIHFEFRLWKLFMEFWIMRNYLKMLEFLGRAPEDMSLLLTMEFEQS